jgi:hypothetical protein
MSKQEHMPAPNEDRYDGPDAPAQGQVFVDNSGGFWRVRKLTMAPTPRGFYLVHMEYGQSLDALSDSMVLGPREFAALVRDRNLRPHLHSV